MPQHKGHMRVLWTFPSSPELWLSALSCSLPGTHRELLGATRGASSTLLVTSFLSWALQRPPYEHLQRGQELSHLPPVVGATDPPHAKGGTWVSLEALGERNPHNSCCSCLPC